MIKIYEKNNSIPSTIILLETLNKEFSSLV